jgi:hypothetical protein
MAADSPRYITLAADVVGTVTFDQDYEAVEILNLDGVEASVRVGGTAPEAGATGTEVMPAAIGPLRLPVHSSGGTVVKLLASTVGRFCVRGTE